MRKIENHCCDCAVPGYPCRGSSCELRRVPVDYCDSDGCDNNAEYRIDGDDYCEDCANEYLQNEFDNLTLSEKAEALKVDLEKIDD